MQDELPWSLWGPQDTGVRALGCAKQDKRRDGEATAGCWDQLGAPRDPQSRASPGTPW